MVVIIPAVLVLIRLSPVPLRAETIRLTLEEAVGLGLKNSKTLRAKILAAGSARTDVASARASLYPGVSTSATWTHFFEQKKTPDTEIDMGFGTPITIPGSYVMAKDPISISAGVSQSIATFGRVKSGIKLAETGVTAAELAVEEEKRSLSVRIQRAFYGYLLAREVLSVQEETLVQKEEALAVARQRFDAGLVPDFEVLSVESDLESFKPQLISARNQVNLALLAVLDLLGIEDDGTYEVDLVGSLEPQYVELDRNEVITAAMERNYDLNAYKTTIGLAERTEDLNRSQKRPVIAGFANYTLASGYDSVTGDNKYWGDDAWDGDLTVGLSFTMQLSSLFPWSSENAGVKKAQLDLEGLSVGLGSIESGIRLNIQRILLQLDEERSKIGSGEKNVELASKLYHSAREQYENGLITNLALDDAQIRLNGARLAYLTAVYGYKNALFDLYDAVGVDRL